MSDLIQFECPTCQKPLRAKAHVAGKVLECPKCKTPVRVPDAQEAFERLEKDRWLERRTFSTMPFRKTRLIAPVWLSIGAWFITLALTITILLITDAHISDRAAFPLVLGLPAIPYIALRIWFLIEMYKVWKRVIVWLKADALPIPVDTAGQAVGFLFIPFFNFWWARRFYGVGAYLNQIIDREKTGTPLAAEDLGNYLSLLACWESSR